MTTVYEENEAVRDRIEALIVSGDLSAACALVEDLHASDLADVIEGLDEEAQVTLLSSLPAELASDALAEMEEGRRAPPATGAFSESS